jgi:3-dehydroquinate dehydratase-2
VEGDIYQSNHEGDIVDRIQQAYQKADGIVLNAGAYTHTSIAILDALKAVDIPTVEVHLTDTENRETFRKTSYVSLFAEKMIKGKGFEGYREAIRYLAQTGQDE